MNADKVVKAIYKASKAVAIGSTITFATSIGTVVTCAAVNAECRNDFNGTIKTIKENIKSMKKNAIEDVNEEDFE